MPIDEPQLNGRIATLLNRMNVRWHVLGEAKSAFQGSMRQPDMLMHQQGGRPVVIENEYVPAHTVEAEAIARLGESLDANVAGIAGNVRAVVALRSPIDLKQCSNHDELDKLLGEGLELEYALFTGKESGKYNRFPKTGFIPGNLKDLAYFISHASVPEDAVQEAVELFEGAIASIAVVMREACEDGDTMKPAIVELLKQEYSDQTLRMAAAIVLNAIVYHDGLTGFRGIKGLDALMPDGYLLPTFVNREWKKILRFNYWSIFKLASDIMADFAPRTYADTAMAIMLSTIERLRPLGVAQSYDLSGAMFQRLIADRKFLATFYTRPESATLLAHLAIPDDEGWDDPERLKKFKIADYACGTGTLIHAAYRRVNQLHLMSGGEPAKIHAHMMRESLTACDVLPSAVHLTASMLSSSHPRERYAGTRTIVTQYGKTEEGGVSIGSLDLLGSNGEVRPLIPLHTGMAVTATGEDSANYGVEMPPCNQDVVIMNPPFTRSGSDWEGDARDSDYVKPFRGLGNDLETQRRMSNLKREYGKGTCAHGYAGLASYFTALADRMVKKDGTIALVLPMTSLQGSSWEKVRQLVAEYYRNVSVITISANKPNEQSFSADTSMAETLLIGRRSEKALSGRGLFCSLIRRPKSEMEALELAKTISRTAKNGGIRTLEEGPYGGTDLILGGERLGSVIDAPLAKDLPWVAAGVKDFSVVQCAHQIAQGIVWMPSMPKNDLLKLPVSTVDRIAHIGIYHRNIAGDSNRDAFTRNLLNSRIPTYPMLWNHDNSRETRLVVEPDSDGIIKRGRDERAADIWETRSHTHHNADFSFGSQPLAVAFTNERTIGGRAWPNVRFDHRNHEVAYSLWGNSTLGLLIYWSHSSRQQAGRGIIPITTLRTMTTLDVTQLSDDQLNTAEQIFEDMRDREFLPANEAYRDGARQELDRLVLVELLKLPVSVLESLDLLRRKWCSEPSVHGGKRTKLGE